MTVSSIQQILKLLPHRYPFLLVDRVIDFVPGVSLTAIKNVTMNEPFFPGHFPEYPVMPGVLIIEAMAQATALLAFKSMQAQGITITGEEIFYFAGIENARFKAPVTPGDQLIIKAELGKSRSGIWKSTSVAMVADKVVCTADLMAAYRKLEL